MNIRLLALALVTAGALLLAPFLGAGIDIVVSALDLGQRKDMPSKAQLARITGDRVVIPAIDLDSPLSDKIGDLDRKVIRYTFSAKPGEAGNTVITAHNLRKSGNPLFSLLFLTKKNNRVILSYGGRQHIYKVTRKVIVTPEEANRYAGDTDSERLTLITCYPPTIDSMRLIVIAEPVISSIGRSSGASHILERVSQRSVPD